MNDIIDDSVKVLAKDYLKYVLCGWAGAVVAIIAIKSVKFAASKAVPIVKKTLDNLEEEHGYFDFDFEIEEL